MIRVGIDTKPLRTGHAIRGVGMYTKNLLAVLGALNLQTLGFRIEEYENNKKYDIIHYPYFDLFFHTLTLERTGKTIVTIHDVIPLIFPEHYPPGIKGKKH